MADAPEAALSAATKRKKGASPRGTRPHLLPKTFLRAGVFSALRPKLALWVSILLSVIVAAGAVWLRADDSLENFLRAETPAYQEYEVLKSRFPASSLDAFVAIEGEDLLSARNLRAMREITFELLLAESVESVASIFSLKKPLQPDSDPESIIPNDIPDNDLALDALQSEIVAHPLARGRLVSEVQNGRRLALFIVALKQEEVLRHGLSAVITELASLLHDTTGDTELSVGLAGIPTMKSEVIESTQRDAAIFSALGLIVGAVVCTFFFRRWRLVLIANVPAALSLVWCLGLFGWTGMRLDPLLNSIMPLVLVVTFNNAMHLLFAICRNLDAGVPKRSAILSAIDDVGPAVALTSITTMVALFSLAFSTSPLIQSFGVMAGVCILAALSIVIAVVPMMASFYLSSGQSYLHDSNPYHGVEKLDHMAAGIAASIGKRPYHVVAAGLLLTITFAFAHFQLEPRYKLSMMLPDHGEAALVTDRIESRMEGLFPLSVMIEWPENMEASSTTVRSAIRDVHKMMEQRPGISKVNSLDDIQRWAEAGVLSSQEANDRMFEVVPTSILSRFINKADRSTLTTGYIKDLEAKDVLALSRDIEMQLSHIKTNYPQLEFTTSGLSYVAAKRSTHVISELSVGLLGAVAVVIVLIGFAFHSINIAGLSTLPNLFAIFATGTWLLLINGSLDYATIVGLTVAFGLAVDDTVHVLNRYQLELQRTGSAMAATTQTLRLIGSVLILTTVILIAGLFVTQVSAVPPTRQFGLVCMVTLLFALAADLVILPALILASARLRRQALSATLVIGCVKQTLKAWRPK